MGEEPLSTLLTGYDIGEYKISDLSDTEIEPILAGYNAVIAEREPRHIDFNVDEFRIFFGGPGRIRHHYLVTDSEGKPAAFLDLTYPDDGTTPRLIGASINVLPEHRRKGVGSKLLRIAADTSRELGREILDASIVDTVPAGKAFAEATGAEPTLDFHLNTVKVADLDLDLLHSWQQAGPSRAPGYSVMVVDGMYPEGLLEGMAHLYLVLERDMPHPDSWEPRTWSGEFVKKWLGNFLDGTDLMTAIALDESGTPVGMSQLGRRHSEHTTWFVTTTMVDPEHRGHALGKWVKAAACLKALDKWPGAVWMETGNAFTNEAMLGINHAMGFTHELTWTEVELTVEGASAYLESRGI
jgi:GNAT superfamily N-acetyltransferase